MRTRRLAVLGAVAVLAAAVSIGNSSRLAPASEERPLLIAHRGLGQTFSREGLTGETCTAERILAPEHPYLENTIASFQAAFDAGADIVEFDVHPTTDGHFVVFHDWTVDCRTEGHGVTRELSLAELQALDIGHGYTADGGRTFPFRGTGIGLMPTLDEVLAVFSDRRFLINIKSDDPEEGRMLARAIERLPPEQPRLIMVYGGGAAIATFRAAMPDIPVLGTDGARRCLLRYGLLGWAGYVPRDCRGALFMLPLNMARYAWGYPNRLVARLARHDAMLVMLGDYDGTGFSSGIDDAETAARLPPRFGGGVWTNRIDRVAPPIAAAAP